MANIRIMKIEARTARGDCRPNHAPHPPSLVAGRPVGLGGADATGPRSGAAGLPASVPALPASSRSPGMHAIGGDRLVLLLDLLLAGEIVAKGQMAVGQVEHRLRHHDAAGSASDSSRAATLTPSP